MRETVVLDLDNFFPNTHICVFPWGISTHTATWSDALERCLLSDEHEIVFVITVSKCVGCHDN